MSSKSMFQPSSSFSLDGHWSPWGHCSPTLTGFPIIPFQEGLQQAPFDQGTKPVSLLTPWPTIVTGVSTAHVMSSSVLTYRYGEQNLFEVSNIQRRNERGKLPSNTHEAAHKWMRQHLLQPDKHRGCTHTSGALGWFPPRKANPSSHSACTPTCGCRNAFKCASYNLGRNMELGTESQGRRWNTIHRWHQK